MDCSINISIIDKYDNITIKPLTMKYLNIEANGLITLPYIADFTDCYKEGYKVRNNNVLGKTHKFYKCQKNVDGI